MPISTRLRVKRGDTAPQFRAQCGDEVKPGEVAPVDLAGATATLVVRREGGASEVLPLVVEDGVAGWVHHDWNASETDVSGVLLGEVEVVFSDGRKQTFPADGYVTIEIVADLNPPA